MAITTAQAMRALLNVRPDLAAALEHSKRFKLAICEKPNCDIPIIKDNNFRKYCDSCAAKDKQERDNKKVNLDVLVLCKNPDCNISFYRKNPIQKYHSAECNKSYWNNYQRHRASKKIAGTCAAPDCDNTWTDGKATKKYCSNRCGSRMYSRRKAEEKAREEAAMAQQQPKPEKRPELAPVLTAAAKDLDALRNELLTLSADVRDLIGQLEEMRSTIQIGHKNIAETRKDISALDDKIEMLHTGLKSYF